jgi:hypothetical protein
VTFLPEEDQDHLAAKQLEHETLTERLANGNERRAILLPKFPFDGSLYSTTTGQLQPCSSCELLILIPQGYATTKLDSFYTYPRLKRADGADPDRATGEEDMFGKKWQFWSRHLDDTKWRPGTDGLATFLLYVRAELRKA